MKYTRPAVLFLAVSMTTLLWVAWALLSTYWDVLVTGKETGL